MEPGPRATNLESCNPLDAKFTMRKRVSNVWCIQSTLVTHFSSNKYTKNLLMHLALGDNNSKITLVTGGSQWGRIIAQQHEGYQNKIPFWAESDGCIYYLAVLSDIKNVQFRYAKMQLFRLSFIWLTKTH